MSARMGGILDVIAQALKPSSDPMPAMRSHPGDAADLSALQLVPHIPKSLINDIAKYGTQAVTGEVSDSDLLYQPELTGNAKALSDRFGDAVGGAINYKNRGLLMPDEGLSVADMIGGAVNAYQGIKPGLIDRIGEANVNRAEGGGLLGAMLIPGQVSKVAPIDKFYSQAVRASGDLQRKQGNADGFFNDLTGKGQVKPDELNAMGFKENFAGRQDVSRQEVQQFIGDNQLQIKETVLGQNGRLLDDFSEAQNALDSGRQIYGVDSSGNVANILDDRGDILPYVRDNFDSYTVHEGNVRDVGERQGFSKFGDYTLEGGDNYREILLQNNSSAGLLDELNSLNKQIGDSKVSLRNDQSALLNVAEDMQRESDKFYDMVNTKETYDNYQRVTRELRDFQDGKLLSDEAAGKYIYGAKELIERRDELVKQKDSLPEPFVNSGHFDEPNILAHLRMKDRVDTDGNKTLLIEEAQSDWHQKGGDVGYKKSAQSSNEIKAKVSEFVAAYPDSLKPEIKKALDTITSGNYSNSEAWNVINRHRELEPFNANDFYDLIEKERQANFTKVPDAPFKTDDKSSWYNLAMKRGLLEAVEGGYDKMAITTGRQQADRYDLSKSINEVRLGGNEADGFTVSAFDKNNNPVIMESIDTLDALPNLIGKDAAKSLVDQPLTDTTSGSARILAGQDLSVGGEGMKQFYDRTLPNALGKLVKQDGQKVGTSFLPRKLQSMDGEFNYEGYTVDEVSDIRNLLAGRNDPMVNHTPEQTQRLKNLLAKEIPEGDTVHSIDITPEMRERVKKGLPLFATAGAALGLTEMMSQQQQQQPGTGLFNGLQY